MPDDLAALSRLLAEPDQPQVLFRALDAVAQRVVVACGSKGIGRSIALGFAAAGASVSICARGRESLDQTAAELKALGVAAHAASCDLADQNAIAAYIEDAARSLGGIDILVNN